MEPVLVPKKLLFTPPSTPAQTPAHHAFTFSQHARPYQQEAATPAVLVTPQSTSSAGPCTPASRQQQASVSRRTPQQQAQPVVRYGVPTDPDAEEYAARFAHSNQRRFGLLDLDDSSSSGDESDVPAQAVTGAQPGRLGSAAHTPGSQGTARSRSVAATPWDVTPGSGRIVEISPVEGLMQQLKIRWHAAAEVKSAERSSQLHHAFQAADAELAQELANITDNIARKQQQAAQADVVQAKQQLQAREQKLQELQRSHDKAAEQQQEQVAKLKRAAEAEQARQKAEQERQAAAAAAAAAKQKAEQEAAAAADAQKKAQEEDQAKAAAQAQAAAVAAAQAPAAKAAAPAADKKASAALRCQRIAHEADAFEKLIAQRATEVQEMLKPLIADDSLKKQRRDIEKKMTVHVQQISATLDQVSKKCGDVYQLIRSQTSLPWCNYALTMFATKVVKQWELVSLNNKAAFPLAAVLVKVSTHYPALMDITLSLMHRECCFAVPCSFVLKDTASGAEISPLQLRRLLGYREVDDESRPGGKMYEADDDFIKRVEGIMFMYGAIVQVPEPQSPHGFDYGWRWLARFLNAIPASRAAAKALIFFLRAAGFGLYGRFRGQFIKLLKCMHDEFLPELAHSTEPDIQAVKTLLEHYLQHGQYNEEPEGRDMPRIDISSYQRA